MIVKQIVRQVAKCSVCGSKDGENPNSHFQKAAVPAKVLQHSIATPSLVAQVMYQKYAMGIPLNRLENDFYRMGLVLPRANMAHWVSRIDFLVFRRPIATISMAPAKDITFPIIIVFMIVIF